jgi:hypothetical protein
MVEVKMDNLDAESVDYYAIGNFEDDIHNLHKDSFMESDVCQ